MIGIELKEFQQRCVDEILENTIENVELSKLILKSPTGSGKTIILVAYIEKYLAYSPNTIFCWFTPGKGELEEQSKEKMEKYSPNLKTGMIFDILNNGFEEGTTYFINWEMVNDKTNIALKETERKNLYNQIAEAHRQKKNIILIIDEEHQNNTAKSNEIINSLSPKYEIRISATPSNKNNDKIIEISETEVIEEGLITKYLLVNNEIENIENIESIEHETSILLKKANDMRKKIQQAYLEENENINPLILIQFPNMNNQLIKKVENDLEKMGYTYENGLVACWFSSNKKEKNVGIENSKLNIENITKNDAVPVFLLFKQAIATGWDCPRAKILVKLRDGMNEVFEIQTLGRLRRMPKGFHYENEILNCSYLYTFDEKYKKAVFESGNGYETKRVFLKDKPKEIILVKEIKNNDFSYMDEKKVRQQLYENFVQKYSLSDDYKKNLIKLEIMGYIFGTQLKRKFLKGKYIKIEDICNDDKNYFEINYEVNLKNNNLDKLKIIDNLKIILGLNYQQTFAIIRNLFQKNIGNKKYKLLNLDTKEIIAFLINNFEILKKDFIEFDTLETYQENFKFEKEKIFKIPLQEQYRYIKNEKDIELYKKNVYINYDSSMIADELRSMPERLFEMYCETSPNVEYYYKNGDKGQQYLSIIYHTHYQKKKLFYPDYIVKLTDGRIFIIETKGGENKNGNKNIDKYSLNKFNSLKLFCQKNSYSFGFVRDKNNKLYFNNTIYSEDMNNKEWISLKDIF